MSSSAATAGYLCWRFLHHGTLMLRVEVDSAARLNVFPCLSEGLLLGLDGGRVRHEGKICLCRVVAVTSHDEAVEVVDVPHPFRPLTPKSGLSFMEEA